MSRRRPLLAIFTLGTLLALPACANAASVQISAVDCDAGGAVATLTNAGDVPRTFTVLRDDRAIASVLVAPGQTETRTVPLAEGEAAQVTVRDGSSYVSSYVRRACGANATTTPATTPTSTAADAPFAATPVIPATGIRGAAQAAASERPANDEVTLRDVAATWPLLAIAGIALLLAAVLAASRLRGRTPERDEQPAPLAPRA
jgi:hypothetical protein